MDDTGGRDIIAKSSDPVRPVPSIEVVEESLEKVQYKSKTQTTLASFDRLVEALYAVRRLCPSLPVLGTPWMHPKHPIHPVLEELLQGKSVADDNMAGKRWVRSWVVGLKGVGRLLWQLGFCVAYAFYLSFTLLRLRWHLRREMAVLKRQRFDLVAKTWCFGAAPSTEGWDFYLGDLQQRFAERGLRLLLLCGDASGINWRTFANANVSTSNLCKLPERCLIHPLVPLQMAWNQLSTSLRLGRIISRLEDPLVKRVCKLARRECLSRRTAQDVLFFWIGKKAVQTWHPKGFLTLYEGHGWEKCAWWGAKTADPACKTIGYQHTALFRESLSLIHPCVDIKERSLPDIVLGLGRITIDQMWEGHAPYGTELIPFGSFRHQDVCDEEAADPVKRTILVTPEGLLSEATALFKFAYECAKLLDQYTFVLRSHPVLPIEKALGEFGAEIRKQPNVMISNNLEINKDFRRSSVLLYRGSSAVFYAVLHGLFPVNVQVENLLDTDPIYMLESWHKICASPAGFAELIQQHERTPRSALNADWRKAVRFVREYTVPVDNRRIDEFLSVAEIRG